MPSITKTTTIEENLGIGFCSVGKNLMYIGNTNWKK
jgi:hypothetical protein